MAGRIHGSRTQPGKILSLAEWLTQHREAAELDLLRYTGRQLDDIGGSLSWAAAGAVFANIQPDSACGRLLVPERAAWATREQTNDILANIYDILAQINANIVAIGTGKPAHTPDPYPRPGAKTRAASKPGDTVRHYGSGALPHDELVAWMEVKRAEARLKQSQSV